MMPKIMIQRTNLNPLELISKGTQISWGLARKSYNHALKEIRLFRDFWASHSTLRLRNHKKSPTLTILTSSRTRSTTRMLTTACLTRNCCMSWARTTLGWRCTGMGTLRRSPDPSVAQKLADFRLTNKLGVVIWRSMALALLHISNSLNTWLASTFVLVFFPYQRWHFFCWAEKTRSQTWMK